MGVLKLKKNTKSKKEGRGAKVLNLFYKKMRDQTLFILAQI